MKHYSYFVGIDVSKTSLDVFVHSLNLHRQLPNNRSCYDTMVRWLVKSPQVNEISRVVVCFEHARFYSLNLSVYLKEQNLQIFGIATQDELLLAWR